MSAMSKPHAAITGVAGWVPEYRLTNELLETMVDTTDDWITSRTGIKERRILKEAGQGTSYMAIRAVKELLEKTGTGPDEIELIVCCTVTGDYHFPATANLIANGVGATRSFGFDINAACSGFLFGLIAASKFIESGSHKKVVVVGADKMSAITDYTDRTTCVLFGDAAAAVMLEPNEEGLGIIDSILRVDGTGWPYLHQKAGGSARPATHQTVDAKEHYIFQEGSTVFKFAVKKMADISAEIMEKNGLKSEDVAWLVPHQANLRIIRATADRMGLSMDKVMINIQNYGNTTAATIPLCLRDWEAQLHKGENLILAAFGGGFTWGAVYLKWAYSKTPG